MNSYCECRHCGRMTWATVIIVDTRGVRNVLCLTCLKDFKE